MKMRIVLQLPDLFKVPTEQLVTEVGPRTGLIYISHKGRTLAIAEPVSGERT